MFLALLTFIVVHPGTVLVGPEANMPGFFFTLKGCFTARKRNNEWKSLSDGEELIGMDQR